jgi:hypothetical protein
MMYQSYRDCPECGQNQPFEQPHETDCPDAPDGQCPEWACAVCGAALIVPLFAETAARVARQQVCAA